MISVRIKRQAEVEVQGHCDWCAKAVTKNLIPVSLITPRGLFQEAICVACADAFEARAE